MTCQQFNALADALNIVKPPVHSHVARGAWARAVRAVANVCADFNKGFSADRFITACVHDGTETLTGRVED